MPLPMPTNNRFQYLKPQLLVSDPATQEPPFPSDQYPSITVSADALAGGEKVSLFILVNNVKKQITDIYGTTINLTATVSAVALEGGPQYVFVKDVTAAACGIYVDPNCS